ncbi:glutamyl-tRNA reductase [Geoglobus ahangari]|uniref:Glutamyl-tRNA reductase n=1 Tax=Geoglobus ahangari TaxID=113653 RepID=A0A0F7IHG8_9EURY|nr:glutamyl-tRNA reductase [Geoglobus ahangari]AKG92373.1 glutamyl-tRNA reductase [Geoglobus ahangari]
MEIANLVISHKKASIDEIQKAWHGDYRQLLDRVMSYPNIRECAILLTCNRVEVYVYGTKTLETLKEFAGKMGVPERIIEIHKDRDTLEHLLRVASGLESMMVGEDQILGQVKEFYNLGKEYGSIGEVLDLVFSKAIQVGKKVRNRTRINKGAVSIGSAAVELAERTLGTLRGKRAMIIGAGEMGRLVAKAIAHKNLEKIYVANRTPERGRRLAEEIGNAEVVPFDRIERYMVECDVVISATSAPHHVITRGAVERVMALRKEPLLIIDIALPRDVEPEVGEVEGVTLYTIDDLREISTENLRKRLREAKKAEEIIKEELDDLMDRLKELKARNAICMMYVHADYIKNEEIIEFYNKLSAKYGVDEDVLPMIESFANSLIKKFLRKPTVRIRKAARNGNSEVIEAVEYLFGGGSNGVSRSENEEVEERQAEAPVKGEQAQH